MSSFQKVLRGMTLVVVMATMAAPSLPAQQDGATAANARVVTVGSWTPGKEDNTLTGFARGYVDPAATGPEARQQVNRYILALQLYHNALASSRTQGRPITDRDLIFRGEKLYLPPKDVLDKIVSLMPKDGSQGITAAKRDMLMHTVLSDVAENKDLIARSKAASNLTSEVLQAAAEVKGVSETSDRTLSGDPGAAPQDNRNVMARLIPDQELDDRTQPSDTTLLGPDGKPLAQGDATTGNPDAGAPSADASSSTGPGLNLDLDIKGTQTAGLEQTLVIAETGGKDMSNPNHAQLADLANRIKAELARRKAAEAKQRQQSAAPNAPTGVDSSASTTATVASGGAGRKSSATTAQQANATPAPADAGAGADANIPMEYVPDWYLKALQEWNLQQYWQTRAGGKADGHKSGKRRYLDPKTHEWRDVDDTADDPFGQFSDQLTNVQNTGTVEKRTDK